MASVPYGQKIKKETVLMVGYPTPPSAENPAMVEILTKSGRSTLVSILDVTALNDDARILLQGSTSPKRQWHR